MYFKTGFMRKIGLLSGVVVLVVGISITALFLSGSYEITNTPPKNDIIVAFGDSLVVGVGSGVKGGFVSFLEDDLGREIVNVGVSGNTTRDGLDRLEKDVLSLEPGVVMILLGGNDYLKRIPKEETFENLRSIIESIQETGAVTVLLGVRGGVLSDGYADMYTQLAEETGSVYVEDVLDGLFGNSQYMSDPIHPNEAGYEIIASKVFQKIYVLF
jgi:acyl-CoA thioesterase-1